jgi:glycosyltransferase involved in cell wall biosynthesis
MTHPASDILVVMPAYNAARFVGEAIDSVIAQTFAHWTLTIVDDGSRDDTAAIAEAYAETDWRIRLRRQPNAGASAARNHGYAASPCTGRFVMFLDSDDVLAPTALETLRDALIEDADLAAAYGLARYMDERGETIRPGELEEHQRMRMGVENGRVVPWPIDRPTTFAVEAVMEYIITPGTVLMRREALDAAGLFRLDFRLWEDWDLWLRMTRRVGDMKLVDVPVLDWRQHDANASGNGRRLEEIEREVRCHLLESLANEPELLQIAQIGYRYQQIAIARKRLAWAGASLARAQVVPAALQLRHAAMRWAGSLRPLTRPAGSPTPGA